MPYMTFDLAQDLAEIDPPLSEEELFEMLKDGVIGMDGFRYCSVEDAKGNYQKIVAEMRWKGLL